MKKESYITKIIEETGLSRKDIQERVEKKKEELKGLISEEGALFIIAKEYGVDVKEENRELIDDIDVNISDISPNMRNIVLTGRIKGINRINEFERKDGSKGLVGSFILQDKSGDIRIVLWDNHVKILQDQNFDINEVVKIINGYAKKGRYGNEIHIGRLGKIILSPEDIDYKKIPKIEDDIMKINEIETGEFSISVSGKIIQSFPISEFQRNNGGKGKVKSINLMDSTGTIRIVFWNENVEKIVKFNRGDIVKITDLNSRKNNRDPTIKELHSSYSTRVLKSEEKLRFEGDLVSDIASLQDKTGLVSFKGVITTVDNLKKVDLKSGDQVSLLGFTISDSSGWIRVTLWREMADKYVEKLKSGIGINLKNVLVKFNDFSKRKEISFIKDSELELIKLDIEKLEYPELDKNDDNEFKGNFTKIKNIESSGNYEIKAQVIKGLSKIVIYEACTQCFKKRENCECEKDHKYQDRMIINLVIDDGFGTMRTTFFGDKAENILEEETSVIKNLIDGPDYDSFLRKKNEKLVGKDLLVEGRAKLNNFSNQYELSVNNFRDLKVNDELSKIMKKIDL